MTAHISTTQIHYLNSSNPATVEPKDSSSNVKINLGNGMTIVGNQVSDFKFLLDAVTKAVAAFNESEPK